MMQGGSIDGINRLLQILGLMGKEPMSDYDREGWGPHFPSRLVNPTEKGWMPEVLKEILPETAIRQEPLPGMDNAPGNETQGDFTFPFPWNRRGDNIIGRDKRYNYPDSYRYMIPRILEEL